MLIKEVVSKPSCALIRAPYQMWSLGMVKIANIVPRSWDSPGLKKHGIVGQAGGLTHYLVPDTSQDKLVYVHISTDLQYTVIGEKMVKDRRPYLLEAAAILRRPEIVEIFPKDFLKKTVTEDVIEILEEHHLSTKLIDELKSYDYVIPVLLLKLKNGLLYSLYGVTEKKDGMLIQTYVGMDNIGIKTPETFKTFEEFYEAITKMLQKHITTRVSFPLLRDPLVRGICSVSLFRALFDLRPYDRGFSAYRIAPGRPSFGNFIWPDIVSFTAHEALSNFYLHTNEMEVNLNLLKLRSIAYSFSKRVEEIEDEEALKELGSAVLQKTRTELAGFKPQKIKELVKQLSYVFD